MSAISRSPSSSSKKRAREECAAEELEELECKRGKDAVAALGTAAVELICPITHELMYRPVLAADGHFYEWSAIRRWIAENAGRALRSPVTNATMDTKLMGPNEQVTNVIKALVDSGALTMEAVDAYRQKEIAECKFKKYLADAQNDSLDKEVRMEAVFRVSSHFSSDKDYREARKWLALGAELGCMRCMGLYSEYLMEGIEGPKNEVMGMHYATVAAHAGSDVANFRLGMLLAQLHPYTTTRFEPDVPRAIEYLTQVVEKKCSLKHLSPKCQEKAETALKALVTWHSAIPSPRGLPSA